MRKIFTLILLQAAAFSLFAQKQNSGSIKGRLADTASKQVLSEATISVIDIKDSSTVAYTVSDTKAAFEIQGLERGDFRLIISFQGYEPIKKEFTLSAEKPSADFGTFYMKRASTLLAEVIVERPPVMIKKDTVEFNAGSFKTKPNATAEDLLKKLPGVQVEKDGTVKAQGEQIQKVYVDGKEFFGTDPKLATKNITADMVESVQVYDDMSDQARFTKIDDGSRQKTINIKLKKDKKKGYFGRATVGAGSDGRYENSLSFNRFNGNSQLSFLAGLNNTNKQGFSFSDVISMMGGFGSRNTTGGGGGGGMQVIGGNRGGGGLSIPGVGTGSNGITRSWNAGVNYRNSFGTKVEMSGSYFYSNTSTETRQNNFRQSFFQNDSLTFTNQDKFSKNDNENHRFNLRVEYKIDSMNSILYTPSFTIQNSESFSNDTSSTVAESPAQKYLALSSKNRNQNERDGLSLNNNLLYRRRLNKIGRTFTLGINNSINNSDGLGFVQSPITFFRPDGSIFRFTDLNQQTTQDTKSNNNTISSSYTEPIGKNKIVELNYAYANNQSTSDRKAYDFNQGSGKYDQLNKPLTNYFENSFISNRLGANFRLQQTKYNFQLGGAAQFATQENFSNRNVNGKDTVVTTRQTFTNFFPTANFTYNYSRTKTLRINYRGRTNTPTVSQLQDVPDVSDPLYIRTGNALLKQEFSHNFNMGYNTFNFVSFRFFSANINFSTTGNKIVNSIDTAGKGVQLIKPVNLDGAYTFSAFVTNGIPIRNKKLKGANIANINLTTILNKNRDISLLNKLKNITDNLLLTQTAAFNYNYKEKLDMGVSASITYNNVKYSISSTPDATYFSQTYSVDFTYTFKKGIVAATDFDYFINSGRAEGYNQNIPMWNASLAKQLFKKKNGELKFSVFDILKQNQSISRSIGDNYIADTRTQVIQRYFLLSFMININKGGMQQNQMRMPGMFRRSTNNLRVVN
ncbi:MAG: hypothetical protein EAZ16_01650 [Sphingobacteriales bacterium]|nr:MAG: hypothetical protein EAZ16_01650 [Sphingobacteriales bacterium]